MHRPLAVTLPQPHTLARGFVNPLPTAFIGQQRPCVCFIDLWTDRDQRRERFLLVNPLTPTLQWPNPSWRWKSSIIPLSQLIKWQLVSSCCRSLSQCKKSKQTNRYIYIFFKKCRCFLKSPRLPLWLSSSWRRISITTSFQIRWTSE